MGEFHTMRSIIATALVWIMLSAPTVFSTSATGTGVCDGTNSGSCCKPDGVQYCAQLTATTNNVSGSVCTWTNLVGQTPDTVTAQNSPGVNNFACGGSDCNYGSTSAIADGVGTAYYGVVSNMSDMGAGATNAVAYYTAFNKALSRYNCEEQYSHWNCDDCRKAYARWACAMTMPACTVSACGSTKPCVRVCNEVVQKCPVTLGFSCPSDNRDYSESSCNLMGLTAGASSTTASVVTGLALSILAIGMSK